MQTSGREVEALVAGGIDFGESDRIVHLITRHGAVSAFAHGAKRSKRRFAGALEPFTSVDVQLTESKRARQGLPTLEQATVKQVRLGLRHDLERIALASFVIELSHRTAPEGEPCDGQYALTEQTLDYIEREGASVSVRRAFEVRLLAELGYEPQLERCIQCGKEPGRTYLDLQQGGLHCSVHRGAAREVGPKTLQWLRAVLASDGLEPWGGCPEDWANTAARRLAGMSTEVWQQLLDRPLKALTMLETLSL